MKSWNLSGVFPYPRNSIPRREETALLQPGGENGTWNEKLTSAHFFSLFRLNNFSATLNIWNLLAFIFISVILIPFSYKKKDRPN